MRVRNITTYFVFNALSALMPIVTLPLLTTYMSPKDFGIWTIFTLAAMYSSTIARWEINTSLKSDFYLEGNDFSLQTSTAFWYGCGWFLILIILWAAAFPKNLIWNGINSEWILAIGAIAFFRYQTVNLHQILQLQNRAMLYGVWSLFSNAGLYGIAIILMIFLNMDWRARAWAEISVGCASFMVAVFFWRKDYGLRCKFSWNQLLRMLRFSTPYIFAAMIGYLLMTADRLFIGKMMDAEHLGLYAIAVQLSASLSLLISALVPEWEAALYKHEGSLKLHIRRKLKKYIVIVFLSLPIILIMPPFLQWLLPYLTQKSFAGAESYIAPALIIVASAGAFALLQPMMVILKKSNAYLKTNIAMLVLCSISMWLLIPSYGVYGAAYSLAGSYILGSVLLYNLIVRWTKD